MAKLETAAFFLVLGGLSIAHHWKDANAPQMELQTPTALEAPTTIETAKPEERTAEL